MAEHTTEDRAKMAPAKLADNFATWWSGLTWTWNPVSERSFDGAPRMLLIDNKKG